MNSSTNLLNLSPNEFINYLKNENITRFHFVYDELKNQVIPSHPQLQQIANFIGNDKRDFMFHEGAFFQISKKHDTLQGAFVHRTNRGQAAGGVRYWQYENMEQFIRDGLRLAKGMTFKNALAGLWWGGGKGVMAHNPLVDKYDHDIRESIYKDYGELMTAINGCYVTAEDVGTNVYDMANIFSKSRFTTCIPQTLGGSGNPSIPTARGVVSGMEAALDFLSLGSLEGKIIAIQGMGNVAEPMIKFLFEKGVKKIFATDIFSGVVKRVNENFSDKNLESRAVDQNDKWIFEIESDIFSPCATGAILNQVTIPKLRTKIVCGAANNQLEDSERDDKLLYDREIIYVPDFLTNRMGIVNCANEDAGYITKDPYFEQHLEKAWEYSIYQMATKVLKESKTKNISPGEIALQLANKLSMELHPIFGHRGKQIIKSLVVERWFDN